MPTRNLTTLIAGCLAVLYLVSSTHAAFYFIQSQLNTALVLTVNGTELGAHYTMQYKNDTNDLQKFEFLANENIRCKGSNLVIDIEGGGYTGSALVQTSPSTSDTQKWHVKGNEIFSRKSHIPDLVMDIRDKNPNPGAVVQVWIEKNTDDDNQEWNLVAA